MHVTTWLTSFMAAVAAGAVLLSACGDHDGVPVPTPAPTRPPVTATPTPGGRAPAPWERTEEREGCENYAVTRNPYFGDLHVHTTMSVDAVTFNVLETPADAYEFARGGEITLAPYDANGKGTRPLRLRRPLDFAAVTDHAEGFGVYHVCFVPGYPGYDSADCATLRETSISADPLLIQQVFFNLLIPTVVNPNPFLPTTSCGDPPADCQAGASVVWKDMQDVAEQFYDRTAECSFTTFIGYEWTGNPQSSTVITGANLHRNVIFRNAVVPDLPVSYIEQPKPQNMWRALRAQCQEKGTGCDWLAIPHNSNISGGQMFLTENADGSPMTAPDARERATSEPLVEIYQSKGTSECRTGADTTDEQCGFELVHRPSIYQQTRNLRTRYPKQSYVRDALKVGLVKEQELGANPFQFGVISSTDTHNATSGATVEEDFEGQSGLNDNTPERRLYLGGRSQCPPAPYNDPNNVTCGRGRADNGSGGLAVVWAEENSRDALFAGLRRRETYGTSGTRPLLRFFAGNYAANACEDADLVATGYRTGVPMGAEIGPFTGAQTPTFAVLAVKDPGEPAATMGGVTRPPIPGTPLQRIQIVKGWVDSAGAAQEKVFDVAGDPNNGASVDLATCTPTGTGFDRLCSTWTDPDFDPNLRAFYYARVLENPTCRWSTMQCNELGVDCSRPESVPSRLVACCDDTIPKTHQERAWSSAIWYRPEGIGAVEGEIRFGAAAGRDELTLEVPLGAGVAHDLSSDALTVVIRDDDVIYEVTIPPGTVRNGMYEDAGGSIGGVKKVTFTQDGTGPATLRLETVPLDLRRAERVEHMIEVQVRIGTYAAAQARLWPWAGNTLGTAS